MALTLRDSHSYETQIIDAVRGVNRALGGTYGTSSAIHKSEFNQYEVQLIDAIKGIGRTLSGNGLSLAGGGASSKELQDLAKRVTKLESESFFRLVSGNVTLKEQYQNLWVPGWLAAGGIGTGGGGGGGATVLNDLEDVTIDTSTLANGDVLAWDPTAGTAGLWVNKPGGGGSYTLPPATTTTLGGVIVGTGLSVDSSGVLSVTGGGGGGAYALGTLTTATATKGTMLGVNAISNDLASTGSESSLIEWEPNAGGTGIGAWHFHGNLYSDGWIAAGGTGTPGGGGGGADLSDVWNSLTNTVADQWATTKIDLAHIPNITASMVSDLGTWASSNLYTLRTHVSTTAANGTLLGVDALSNASSSVSGSDSTRIEWDNDHNAWRVRGNLYADGWVAAGGVGSGGGGSSTLGGLSDVTLSSTITDGQALVYDETNGYWKNATIQGGGDVYIGNDSHSPTVADVVASSYENRQVLCYISAAEKWTNVRLSLNDIDLPSSIASSSGYLYHDPVSGWAVMPGGGGGGSTVSWGTLYSNDTINLTVNGTTHRVCLNGYSSGGGGGGSTVTVTPLVSTGTKIATITVDGSPTDLWAPTSGGGSGSTVNWGVGNDYYVPLTVDNVTKNVLIGTNYVTLDTTQTITGAKTFTTNPVTIGSSSGLSVHQNSYIDIGNVRLVYDSSANALHVTKKPGASGTIGLYADGFVAAGGSA